MPHSIIRTLIMTLICLSGQAQQITGVWKGQVVRGSGLLKKVYRLELKLVVKGDSLVGTSYYHASANDFARFAVKGYFDPKDNSVNWWDEALIDSRSSAISLGRVNRTPLVMEADINCPGSGVMMLDGQAKDEQATDAGSMELHLTKVDGSMFRDDWDAILQDRWLFGAGEGEMDSAYAHANEKRMPVKVPETVKAQPTPKPKPSTTVVPPIVKAPPVAEVPPTPATVSVPQPVVVPVVQPTVEEQFRSRKNILTSEIPISGDSIEFRFYDNAEVDGDSISVFLNGNLLQTHVRLTEQAYTIRFATAGLLSINELVMVAENLGSIPPNTAYMEAWSGGIRYVARLESTEQSSAMIRLVRR